MTPQTERAPVPLAPEEETAVFFGGPIRTLAENAPATVEAVGTRGGHIAAVGARSEVEKALTSAAGHRPRPVDLHGATLLPGFIDSHTHLGHLGTLLSLVDLEGVDSLEKALEKVAAFAKSVGPGKWVGGGRWNKNLWGRFPNRQDLDRVVPDRPVALQSKDGHCFWVNSEALRRAGVTRETPEPEGGEIERDASGEPTGILKENAGGFIWAVAETPGPADYASGTKAAIAEANRLGLVGLCDMNGHDSVKVYQALERSGELNLRIWSYVPDGDLPHLAALGLESGFGNRRHHIAGIKAFLDGALGSQTAYMLEPYEGSESRGISTMTPEAFDDLVGRASAEGLAVAVHAIGDLANRVALDAFEKHQAVWQGRGLRHRIEHLQLLDPKDLPRVGRLGVVASMQPIHAPSDRDIADKYWGPKRSALGYAWRSVAVAGAILAFGSDVPVETYDPLQGLFAAVTRRHPADPGREPWHFEQGVTPLAAVRAYTVGAAYAVGAEKERGTLERGKLSDFTILSDDILAGPGRTGPAEAQAFGEIVLRTKVVGTVVGGNFVYGGDSF